MDADPYLRKLHFRAHHRGTREADAMVGGFFDTYHAQWSERISHGSNGCWKSRMSTSWLGPYKPQHPTRIWQGR